MNTQIDWSSIAVTSSGTDVEVGPHYLRRWLAFHSQAVRSAQTVLPMARAMVLDFQDDPATCRLDLQYLFGDDFLVAPVVRRDGRCRVYLPAGDWLDCWTKETVCGPRWLDLEVSLEVLPPGIPVRDGSLVVEVGPSPGAVEVVLYGLRRRGQDRVST
jgi:hypothetical protein